MNADRTQKGIQNVVISTSLYIAFILFEFLNRSIFVKYLDIEYLGLNGLFRNIVSFLSLSELGIGTAISFSLYKPLCENRVDVIKALMGLYKKLYRLIGIVILLVGGILLPFLPFFMNEAPEDTGNIYLYYAIYVLNAGVSYFYTYKRTIIICDQKQYISSITTLGSKIIVSLTQIMILIYTQNYFGYLVVMLCGTVAENILISYIADRQYPYLKDTNVGALDEGEKKVIKKNIYAMFFHKMGTVVISSTDNIVISKFVSLAAVGIYSNYSLVTNALNQFMSQIFSALTAGIGNLNASENDEYKETVFYRILFMNFLLYGESSVFLLCLFQPFVRLWVGEDYLADTITLVVIVLNFFINGMRNAVLLFKNASGVFFQDRYKPIFESIINLGVSICLSLRYGIKGVLIGTIISMLSVSVWVEGRVLFKYIFHGSVRKYLRKQLGYFSFFCILAGTAYAITNMVQTEGLLWLILKFVFCFMFVNMAIYMIYRKKELEYWMGVFKKVIKMSFNRRHG